MEYFKKVICAFCVFCFLIMIFMKFPSASEADEMNLIRNGSFEGKLTDIGLESCVVENWRVTGDIAGFVRKDEAEPIEGYRSLKIEFLKKQKQDWKIYQVIPGNQYQKNVEYLFRGWMKTYEQSAFFEIQLRKKDKVLRTIIIRAIDNPDIIKSDEMSRISWWHYSVKFNSMDSDSIVMACGMKNEDKYVGDTCWFDGLSIKRLKDKEATSPAPLPDSAYPKELYASLKGKDDGDGSVNKPFRSIQKAIELAGPGTTIRVAKGVYIERLVFPRSGTKEKPIVLQGEEGVIIEGGGETPLQWEKAPDWGEGVYKAKSEFVRVLFADGKDVLAIRYERTHPQVQENPVWQYRNLFRNGVIDYGKKIGEGFDIIKGLWMYNPEDHYIYIKFGDKKDPNRMSIRAMEEFPVIQIEHVNYVTVQNVSLRFAIRGCNINHATGIVVQNCKIGPIEYGISMFNSGNCRILNNEVTLGAYNNMNPHEMNFRGRFQSDVWNGHKWAGYYDRSGICLTNGLSDNEIAYNYVHDHWDGIQNYGTNNRGLKVHHNTIRRCEDDGLVFNAQCEDQEWHSNTVESAFCNFRIYPTKGPVYIYCNRFINGFQEELRLWLDSSAYAYIYHNTVEGTYGLSLLGQSNIGVPNFRIYNNRFLNNYLVIMGGLKVTPNFQADYNCYLTDKEGYTRKYGFEKHGTCGKEFVAKGVDLSKFFGRPLPGCKPGYFKGKSPDCGVYEIPK